MQNNDLLTVRGCLALWLGFTAPQKREITCTIFTRSPQRVLLNVVVTLCSSL